MQIMGILKVKDRVLTTDKVTRDLFDSILVEVDTKSLEFTMPRPLFMDKDDKELQFTLQYTSSGTIALFLGRAPKAITDKDELRELARQRVLLGRQTEANKSPVERANEVEEDSDEFKEALKAVTEENKSRSKSDKPTAISARMDDDGNPISDKDA